MLRLRPLSAVLLALVFLVSGCSSSAESAEEITFSLEEPTVILLSIDGVRADYPELYETPNLDRIAERGTRASHLIAAFPTKTFPNHYTLVTGLYPSNHGIISNTMYDPEMDASFSLGNEEAIQDRRWWDDGEPIWVTGEQQGLTTATYFWPGSEAPIRGVRPTYWNEYDGSVPGDERVDTVLEWLDLPDSERPQFITLYFSEVDTRGHSYGPETEEVAEAMQNVDGYLGRLLDGLESRDLLDDVHLIVTTDHGMSTTSPERVILLDDYIDLDDVHVEDYTPVAMLQPDEGKAEEVYQALHNAHPSLDVYWKEDVPEALHFRDHRRIPRLVAIAEDGWSISTREYFERDPARFDGGAHGYDPRLESMWGIFYAMGPVFQEGHETTEPFESIHLYALMAEILGLEPAPNDGSLHEAHRVLELREVRSETTP